MTAPSPDLLLTCLRCGLTQRQAPIQRGRSVRCRACDEELLRLPRRGEITASFAFALAALILFPAAILLPVMELTKLGHTRPLTVWSGAIELITGGELAVGLLVFVCSIVTPILKIAGILALDLDRSWRRAGARRAVHRIIDWIGRWSMLDVLLVAVLVAAIKIGNWANIHAGPGAAAFAGVVVLSMLASAMFRPPHGAAA